MEYNISPESTKTPDLVTPKLVHKVPHILKYMGSKREILDFIVSAINDIKHDNNLICDLFAGSCVVTGALKNISNIHSNDIQEYSTILANTYFSDFSKFNSDNILNTIFELASTHANNLLNICPDLITDYNIVNSLNDFLVIEGKQMEIIDRNFTSYTHYLFTKTYSGTYWSFEQCVWIDALRKAADLIKDPNISYAIIASLMFAMSYNSQSTGHYAQYRDAISEESMKDIIQYRQRSIWTYFKKKFKELTDDKSIINYKLTTSSLDYLDCLDTVPTRSIIYADPPYASVHYSRFYHALETLVKYDYPDVYYKGRYRTDRHQSPFCKGTQVNNAFSLLFQKVKNKKSNLVLSYSNTGVSTLDSILAVAKQEYGSSYKTEVREIDHFHSAMGRTQNRQQVKEYLIVFESK